MWEELTDAKPVNPLAQALRRKAVSLPQFTAFLDEVYLISAPPSMHAWLKLQSSSVNMSALERYLVSGDTPMVVSAITALSGQLNKDGLAMALFSFGLPPQSNRPTAVNPSQGSISNDPIVFFQDSGEITEEVAREQVQLRADAASVASNQSLLLLLASLAQQRDVDAVKAIQEPALRRLIAFDGHLQRALQGGFGLITSQCMALRSLVERDLELKILGQRASKPPDYQIRAFRSARLGRLQQVHGH